MAGLGVTRRYVLSHHESHDWDRCHTVAFPRVDRPLRLCARCSGIYPGIALGIVAPLIGFIPVSLPAIALLPAFTIVERASETWTGYRGSNRLRTLTGLLLGVGYGMGLVALMRPDTRMAVLAVGVGYGILGAGLLWRSRDCPRRGRHL